MARRKTGQRRARRRASGRAKRTTGRRARPAGRKRRRAPRVSTARGRRKPAARPSTAAQLERRLVREQRGFERRLTAMVQEIGQLRQYEDQAHRLREILDSREGEIARLRERVRELEERLPSAAVEGPGGPSDL